MADEIIQEVRYQVGEAWKGTYDPNENYSNAAVVQDATGLSIYRSLRSGNAGHPVSDATWWFKIIDMSSIKSASDVIVALNTAIAADEASRVSAENSRVSAENSRVSAENSRASAESSRVSAESTRVTNENSRQSAENGRSAAEAGRISAEATRQSQETTRQEHEASRQTAEGLRETAEGNRASAETSRASAESTRVSNENTRISNETAREAQASSDHTTAAADHAALSALVERADADHTQAASDHTTAAGDHTQAGTDHTAAAADHTQAGTDHTQAGTDHTTAAGDHTQAGEDHAQYVTDHASIASKANVAANPTAGHLAGLDSGGNPTDSGSGIDADPTENSDNVPKSGGVFSAIATAVTNAISTIKSWAENLFLQKGTYDASTAVGLADNIRGDVYADEQFAVRMTGGEANEVGGIGVVQQLKGAGAAISQLFPEGANHDFSGDVSLDGTGGNAEAVLRYSNDAGTVEMGYLLAMEAFISQTLSQAQLDAISAKDSGKADRDKAVWLTPAGAITSAPTIESGQTEVTFSGWRIAMRVKASEVRDASASSYWFTSGTAGRQVFDVAVAEGIDVISGSTSAGTAVFGLANGWNTGSAMEYLNHMAAQGLPTHSVKAMSALLSVTKIGIKTVKSRNLLNPQTGRALLKAYVNDDENFQDNEYTMLGGLPSGSTMAFTSLLTGKTETLTMLDSTHFVIPSDGWLQITGTLPESIIATWDGTKDNTAADEYATESHVWDVTQLFGTKDGGTEGHYYRFAKEGMKGVGSVSDLIDLVDGEGSVKIKSVNMGTLNYTKTSLGSSYYFKPNPDIADLAGGNDQKSISKAICVKFVPSSWNYGYGQSHPKNSINTETGILRIVDPSFSSVTVEQFIAMVNNVTMFYQLKSANIQHFTSLFLSASSTADELTAMPADAIPLSEIQFADNNWSIEEAIYDAPEADANGVIDTIHQVTGQMRIQYSLDAAEQIDTLQKEYQALEARVTALENA